MPRGGPRPGAGRKAGTPNKASQARQAQVAATGETPLDYMLSVMRDEYASKERRDEMAKAAAPYVHPRLVSKDVNLKADVSDSFVKLWAAISNGTAAEMADSVAEKSGPPICH